ncbi:MAG: hypothetical protein AABZ32_12570, partial [Bacteroidota bacterium]
NAKINIHPVGTYKISKHKRQMTNKFQSSNFNSQTNNENELFCILNFGYWILFEICFLMLGVFRGYPMFGQAVECVRSSATSSS